MLEQSMKDNPGNMLSLVKKWYWYYVTNDFLNYLRIFEYSAARIYLATIS